MEGIRQARFSCKADTSSLYHTSPVGIVSHTNAESKKIVTHRYKERRRNHSKADDYKVMLANLLGLFQENLLSCSFPNSNNCYPRISEFYSYKKVQLPTLLYSIMFA